LRGTNGMGGERCPSRDGSVKRECRGEKNPSSGTRPMKYCFFPVLPEISSSKEKDFNCKLKKRKKAAVKGRSGDRGGAKRRGDYQKPAGVKLFTGLGGWQAAEIEAGKGRLRGQIQGGGKHLTLNGNCSCWKVWAQKDLKRAGEKKKK